MPERIKAFLDTSAVFAGMWSSTGGAHLILSLGEAGTLDIWVSPQVLSELETVLRQKAPALLGEMALLLDRVQVHVGETAPSTQVQEALARTSHAGDARVIADAMGISPDFFVSLDRKHFLDNEPLRAALPFPMGTPGDFLNWFRERYKEE